LGGGIIVVFHSGIDILKDLLVKVAMMENKTVAQAFYQKHFMSILEHVLGVVTDHNQVPFIGRIQ
jgi:CRM1 C terminal